MTIYENSEFALSQTLYWSVGYPAEPPFDGDYAHMCQRYCLSRVMCILSEYFLSFGFMFKSFFLCFFDSGLCNRDISSLPATIGINCKFSWLIINIM